MRPGRRLRGLTVSGVTRVETISSTWRPGAMPFTASLRRSSSVTRSRFPWSCASGHRLGQRGRRGRVEDDGRSSRRESRRGAATGGSCHEGRPWSARPATCDWRDPSSCSSFELVGQDVGAGRAPSSFHVSQNEIEPVRRGTVEAPDGLDSRTGLHPAASLELTTGCSRRSRRPRRPRSACRTGCRREGESAVHP